MPRTFRLTRADFKGFATRQQRRVRLPYFTLGITPLPSGSGVKVACIVSKKVTRKATDRNKLKRRLREILRPLVFGVRQPIALAFYMSATASSVDIKELEKSVQEAIKGAL